MGLATVKAKFGFSGTLRYALSEYVRVRLSLTLYQNDSAERRMTISLSDPRNHWMVRLWEDYCAKFSVCSPVEEDVDEVDARRNSMMEEWQSYASTFGVAAPEDQLPPDTWGDDLPPPDEEGKLNPHIVKNWRFWLDTRAFLRERYDVLNEPSLTFDCQVRNLGHPPVPISVDDRQFYGYPAQGDPPEWYAQAIQMTIYRSDIRFSCRSQGCRRRWCDLKKRGSVDIYGLVKVFHRFGKMLQAQKVVAKWYEMALKPLKSAAQEKELPKRFKVYCEELNAIISRYTDQRDEKVGGKDKVLRFINEAVDLIRRSPLEEYSGKPAPMGYVCLAQSVVNQDGLWKMGTAARLWLWMWCYQSERARKRKERKDEFTPSDKKVAELWGVSESTVKRQRKTLEKLGYFRIVDEEWRVFFNPKE